MLGFIMFIYFMLVLSLACVYIFNYQEIKNLYDLGNIAKREYRGAFLTLIIPTFIYIVIASFL